VVAGRLATTKRSVLLLGPRQVGNRRSAAASAPGSTSTSRTRPLSLGASVWALHSTSGRVPFRPELSKRSVASAADDREDTCKGGSPAA